MLTYLIQKYRLYPYYQIDSTSQFAYAKVVSRLSENIKLKKTDFNVIEITVRDKDRYPPIACATGVNHEKGARLARNLHIILQLFLF